MRYDPSSSAISKRDANSCLPASQRRGDVRDCHGCERVKQDYVGVLSPEVAFKRLAKVAGHAATDRDDGKIPGVEINARALRICSISGDTFCDQAPLDGLKHLNVSPDYQNSHRRSPFRLERNIVEA
jgi:hypothetical protein